MVGGGIGAFIGDVHRKVAALDGHIELVCGAFSSNPERSQETGKQLYLDENRVYDTYQQMFEEESKLPEGERMDMVSIVTPNHLHFEPAKIALENGFHVVCDKPITISLEEAKELKKLTDETGLVFALTHTYTGYPMVKQARDMVADGVFGDIRKVVVEYPQGWLATRMEESNKQAAWRSDPKKSGKVGAMGDIGTHAENLVSYITGLKIEKLCADLSTIVDGRVLDDDGNVLLRYNNGARGVLHCSQISAGEENNLKIYVYGEDGGFEWHQHEPNTLLVKHREGPTEIYRTGVDKGYLSEGAMAHTRVPGGHPEGYMEAFANIYRNAAKVIQAKLEGNEPDPQHLDFPGVDDGVEGMAFIDTVVESTNSDKKWTEMKT